MIWGQEPPERKAAGSESKTRSLIRKDLLLATREDPGPPQRNIFSPGLFWSEPAVIPQGNTSVAGHTAPEGLKQGATTSSALDLLNMRYIGFIRSPGSITALVILEGRVLAVKEGEVIGDGMRMSAVTVSEVEVVGPDSGKRKFPLEGEER